jgi:protease-4
MAVRIHWLVALVAVFFVAGIVLLGVGLWLGSQAPRIESQSALVIELAGELLEDIPSGAHTQLFFDDEPTVWDMVSVIDEAAEDTQIAALLLKLRSPGLGWAKIEELRDALTRFRATGKPVLCWLESGDDSDYYLATATDEISAPSGSSLRIDGLASYVSFFKGTLDWAGVTADLEHVGQYKDASETYTRKQMSEPSREALESLLDDRFSSYLEAISESREWDIEVTRGHIDEGPYTTEEAAAAGLLDTLYFEDEVESVLLGQFEGELIHVEEYFEIAERRNRGARRIALVFASGTVVSGESGLDPLWGRTLGERTLAEALLEALDDDRVDAIVLRIDSPGGETDASRALWHAVRQASAEKPVIASFSDVAASGGYYLAMGADSIVAQPGTLTGSIGVLGGKFNISGLYEKLGIDVEVVSRGRNAQFYSPFRDFTPVEREKYLAQLGEDYRLFLNAVVENRGQSEEEIERRAQGRVWTGGQAYVNGLVDALGGFRTAINMARQSAGIEDDERVRYVVYPRVERTFLQRMIQELFITTSVQTPWGRLPAAGILASVARLSGNTSLTWMPYEIVIR